MSGYRSKQHQQHQHQQQRQQQQQHQQQHRQRRIPNGDESSIGSNSRQSSCHAAESDDDGSVLTGALNELRVQCPHCAHRFPLSEGLLMADPEGDEAAAAACATAAAADAAVAGPDAFEAGAADFGPCGSSAESLAQEFATAGNETLLRVAPGSSQYDSMASDIPAAAAAESAPPQNDETETSQPVSRCFQIINWTVEELEKVICDPNDRRIRKISSITQCDIEVRSEMAQSRFGAPKNFCILRASQPVSIDQCRSLLKRQLLWVLRPRAQDSEMTR